MQFRHRFVYFAVGQPVPTVFTFAYVIEHVEHDTHPVRVTGQLDDFLFVKRIEFRQSFGAQQRVHLTVYDYCR